MQVSSIEISESAIPLANIHFNNERQIIDGSVADLPFTRVNIMVFIATPYFISSTIHNVPN